MKAAVCNEFGKPLEIEDVEIVSPKEKQVKVRLVATAVCHSDIHDIKGELPGPLPCVGGHESSGYVDEIGSGVTNVKVGDRVVVTLMAACGGCYFCVTGRPHLCENRFANRGDVRLRNKDGVTLAPRGGVGGFAEYVVVGDNQLIKVPDGMPLDSAALLACGVMTGFGAVVNRAQVRPFQSVAVIGLGGVGINAIQGAAYSGAYPIIAIDVLDSKMEMAKSFGATHGIKATSEKAIEQIRELTSGRGLDYVFVAVGNVGAIRQSISMLGPRGTSVMIGLPPIKDMLSLMPIEMIGAEKALCGCFMGSTNIQVDVPNLMKLYQSGQLKLDELITARYPLEKINEAIASTEKGEVLRNVIMFE